MVFEAEGPHLLHPECAGRGRPVLPAATIQLLRAFAANPLDKVAGIETTPRPVLAGMEMIAREAEAISGFRAEELFDARSAGSGRFLTVLTFRPPARLGTVSAEVTMNFQNLILKLSEFWGLEGLLDRATLRHRGWSRNDASGHVSACSGTRAVVLCCTFSPRAAPRTAATEKTRSG